MKKLIVFLFVILSFDIRAEELNIMGKVSYDVKIAKTIEQKQKGLMFVKYLPEDKGMLFDVRENEKVSMWMKNTYVPLDMIFLDCEYKIVDVYKNAKPHSIDEITSDKNFCYVLEVNGGEFDKRKLKIGETFLLKNKKIRVR
ncbi:MAG: DUF192 domain-containing protein [Alphaproteobacteria bacterium]|nr:DUF192 domain-containing protein [Alphaproteobacteria bacterium]